MRKVIATTALALIGVLGTAGIAGAAEGKCKPRYTGPNVPFHALCNDEHGYSGLAAGTNVVDGTTPCTYQPGGPGGYSSATPAVPVVSTAHFTG